MSVNQTAEVDWRNGGAPVSVRFDDPYFSVQDGYAETRHVFLDGNGLPGRFRGGFHIMELGFGTGLNLLATAAALRDAGCPGAIRYSSFEAYPLSLADMSESLSRFPFPRDLTDPLLSAWGRGARAFSLPGIEVRVVEGDARSTLPVSQEQADAWYLDGFSPAKNPELWQPDLMREVARHTAPDGTFATYTAAGHVRRSLEEAGFAVRRIPGYGRKRHMTVGILRDQG